MGLDSRIWWLHEILTITRVKDCASEDAVRADRPHRRVYIADVASGGEGMAAPSGAGCVCFKRERSPGGRQTTINIHLTDLYPKYATYRHQPRLRASSCCSVCMQARLYTRCEAVERLPGGPVEQP